MNSFIFIFPSCREWNKSDELCDPQMYLTLVFFVTYFGQILTKTSRFVRKFYFKSFDKKIIIQNALCSSQKRLFGTLEIINIFFRAGEKMTEEYPSPSVQMWCQSSSTVTTWTSFVGRTKSSKMATSSLLNVNSSLCSPPRIIVVNSITPVV